MGLIWPSTVDGQREKSKKERARSQIADRGKAHTSVAWAAG